jgi:uncharacterized protein involved in outer membrane biogenesis
MLRRLAKIFLSMVLVLLLLVLAAFTLVHVYQDEIVAMFVQQANRYVKTPVKAEKISVSLFSTFPHAAVTFENVWIKESYEGSDEPLATAGHIHCSFSLFDLLRKKYRIREIQLQNAEVFLKVKANGEVNYTIIEQPDDEPSNPEQSLRFDLNSIKLENVRLHYADKQNKQHYKLLAKYLRAGLGIDGPVYSIELKGNLHTDSLLVSNDAYLRNQPVELSSQFTFNNASGELRFAPTNLLVQDSDFWLEGTVGTSGTTRLDLTLEAKKADFQTIEAILPLAFTSSVRNYRSKGDVWFKGTVKGLASSKEIPEIAVDFKTDDASFYHPDYKQALEKIELRGSFSNGSKRSAASSVLRVDKLEASLNGRPVRGSFTLSNFDDYYLSFRTDSELDANSLLHFYPIEGVSNAGGLLKVNMEFKGRLQDLKQSSTLQRIQAGGEVVLRELKFQRQGAPYPFKGLNGSLIFRNQDLALSNLSGNAGSSHFVINGLFKNIFAYLLLENQPIAIEADLQSDFLNLDELLADAKATESKTLQASAPLPEGEKYYAFDIRPDLNLYFNCQVKRLHFDRFRAKDIAGELVVEKGVAYVKGARLSAAGGKMQLNGHVDARRAKDVIVTAKARFDGINADSVFYVFHNFSQDFLADRHLQGKISANVSTSMEFDKKLRFRYEKLIVDSDMLITNGQLKGFEPMQALSAFINEKRLADISFSNINSKVSVRNETIYLPSTTIESDITTVTITGTHTFSQQIDYSVKVPLKAVLTGKKEQMPPSAVRPEAGAPHLFVRIYGTTDDYKIGYDTYAVKEKIVTDIKKEKEELKEVFKNKGRKTEDVVKPAEEEFFDW